MEAHAGEYRKKKFCHLHLKRLPALASAASQFQSNTENTKLVSWLVYCLVDIQDVCSSSSVTQSCHQLANVLSWNITALCESTNLTSSKHFTTTPVQIVGKFVQLCHKFDLICTQLHASYFGIWKNLVIMVTISLYYIVGFHVTSPFFELKSYQSFRFFFQFTCKTF